MNAPSATRRSGRRRWLAAFATVGLLSFLGAIAPVQAAPEEVEDGSLVWGVKQSFRNYIVGPIAHGHIQVSDGASQAEGNGAFTFVNASGIFDADTGAVDAAFEGTVHFQGHEGVGVPAGEYALDLKIQNVRVEIEGTSGTLVADVSSKSLSSGSIVDYPDVEFAALNLSSVTPSIDGDTVTFTAIPATLTEAGVPAFADFYTAGTELDPLTFTLTLGEGGGEPEPDPDAVTQTITTTVVASGGLSISVEDDQVALPTPELNQEGTKLVSEGALNPVTVIDLRTATPGWNVNGQVSDFTSSSDSFGGENLGWTPEVVSSSEGQTVAPGAPVAPGEGIGESSVLGSAEAGEGRGTAVLGADLLLEIPTDTEPGDYTATVTLTVI